MNEPVEDMNEILPSFLWAINQNTMYVWKLQPIYIGRLRISGEQRRKKNLWGRFGGGWNWALGFEASRTSLILNLLVCMFRFSWHRKQERD